MRNRGNLPYFGDDRLRRERLVPECEPSGADLVNSAQKLKCQQHFIRCYAPRCISETITASLLVEAASTGTVLHRVTDWARQRWSAAHHSARCAKDIADSRRVTCPLRSLRRQTSAGYARRFPWVDSFGRGFDSRHLHTNVRPAGRTFCYHCLMIRLTWTILLLFGMAGTGCQSTGILPSPTIPATLQEAASPTATLELSPTLPPATETLIPPPQTFTENFNGSLPYWAFLQIDNGQTFVGPSVQGAYLVFDLPPPNQCSYPLYPSH